MLLLALPVSAEIVEQRFPCGLRAVIVEDARVPQVAVQLCFRAGRAQQPPHLPDVCERIGHALLRPELEPAATARVEQDASCIELRVPAAQLAAGLTQQLDRLGALETLGDFPPVQHGSNHHAAELEQMTLMSLFPSDHPYYPRRAAVVIGLDLDDERDRFRRTWFTPANAILFVYGDASGRDVIDIVAKRAAAWGVDEAPTPRAVDLPKARRINQEDEPAFGVELLFVTPGAGTLELATYEVLLQHLCNPVDGLLYRRLVLDLGAGPPRWERITWRNAGMLALTYGFACSPANKTALIDATFAVLNEAQTALPEPVALRRARALAELARLKRRATFAARAEVYRTATLMGDPLLPDLERERLQRVGVTDLQECAARLGQARVLIRTLYEAPPENAVSEAWTLEALRGEPELCVLRYWRNAEFREIEQLAAGRYSRWSPAELRDLLSYRGVELRVFSQAQDCGLEALGPPRERTFMEELLTALLTEAPAAGASPDRESFLRAWETWTAQPLQRASAGPDRAD